jgi:hypothetical protein
MNPRSYNSSAAAAVPSTGSSPGGQTRAYAMLRGPFVGPRRRAPSFYFVFCSFCHDSALIPRIRVPVCRGLPHGVGEQGS